MFYAVRLRLDATKTSWVPEMAGPSADSLAVGQDKQGRWIVRDKLGLKGGIFATLKAALDFANAEAEAAGCPVELTAGLIDSCL